MGVLRKRFWSPRDRKVKQIVCVTVFEWKQLTDKQKTRYLKFLHSLKNVEKAYRLLIETFPTVQIYRRMPDAAKFLILADIRSVTKGETVRMPRREKQGIVPPLVERLFRLEMKRLKNLQTLEKEECSLNLK